MYGKVWKNALQFQYQSLRSRSKTNLWQDIKEKQNLNSKDSNAKHLNKPTSSLNCKYEKLTACILKIVLCAYLHYKSKEIGFLFSKFKKKKKKKKCWLWREHKILTAHILKFRSRYEPISARNYQIITKIKRDSWT